MEITKLEKAALITTGAAAAYKTLLWSLEANIDSTDPAIYWLRIIFAALSFVAFDLVITSVVFRGWSWGGAGALLVAAAVSAAIGLDVARVYTMPALHAAPAITLAAFGAHLMWSRRIDMAELIAAAVKEASAALEAAVEREKQARLAAEQAHITQAVQVNVVQQLPPTVAAYIAARAAELPESTPDELAQLLGVGVMSVRKVLQISEQEVAQ
jgi:hypothetical protein